MFTSTSVISERKKWFQYAKCFVLDRGWFLHAKSNFYTQYEFDSNKCDYNKYECDFNTHKSDFYLQNIISTHRVWFYTHECNFDTFACENDTHECDLYTTSAISHAKWV
jgi:hypothetical protein